MFTFFLGNIKEILSSNSILVTNDYFGLEIFVPYVENTDKEVKLYLLNTFSTDHGFNFFGFYSLDELNFFKILISVPGLGAKTAIKLVSTLGFEAIGEAINNKDHKVLTTVSGIGAKIATRIVNDLHSKVPKNFSGSDYELITMLVSIGYKPQDISSAIKNIEPNLSIEEKVQIAITNISNNF